MTNSASHLSYLVDQSLIDVSNSVGQPLSSCGTNIGWDTPMPSYWQRLIKALSSFVWVSILLNIFQLFFRNHIHKAILLLFRFIILEQWSLSDTSTSLFLYQTSQVKGWWREYRVVLKLDHGATLRWSSLGHVGQWNMGQWARQHINVSLPWWSAAQRARRHINVNRPLW